MWALDHKEGWAPKSWCFQTVVLGKTLKSPLDSKEINPVSPEVNQPWIFTGRTDAEAPIPWPPDVKNWLIGKDPDVRRASLVAQMIKNPPAIWETWVRSLGWEDPLEKGMAAHSSILAWTIPQSVGLQRVRDNWATFTLTDAGKDSRQKENRATEGERFRWHRGLPESRDRSVSKLQETVKDTEAWRVSVHGVAKSRPRLRSWTTANWCYGTHNIKVGKNLPAIAGLSISIPHASGQLSLTTTTTDSWHQKPVLRSQQSHCKEKPTHHKESKRRSLTVENAHAQEWGPGGIKADN